MDKILTLFLIGIAVGIIVPIAEQVYNTSQSLDDPLTAIQHVFVAAARLWHLAISILVLVTLPVAIFKTLRNRLSQKKFLPIPFMTGISFGFTFMTVLGLFVSYLQN